MLIAHSIAGWLIFLGCIALFWAIVFRFFVRRPAQTRAAVPARKKGVLCGICEDVLTLALPTYRCECGKFCHVACAVNSRTVRSATGR